MKFPKPLLNGMLIAVSITSILIVFIWQLLHVNPFTSSWDQVDFALAVTRYDLMAMQPHFPGYPFFILGGKIINLFVNNPSKALTIFNILFYASAIVPIYKCCRGFLLRGYAWLSASIIYTASYCIIMVNQPMSEGAALASFWWYLWSLLFALNRKNNTALLFPLALLSVMLGIRLSYLPFAAGIVFVFYAKAKNKSLTPGEMIHYSLFGLAFQACWVAALVISEGSLTGFIKLSLAFTSGHFNEWGGAIETSEIGFWERLRIFIWDNIIWTGIAAHSFKALAFYTILLALSLAWVFSKQEKSQKHPNMNLFYVMFSCYFVWGLFAQNIEKARHILPLVILLVFYLCIILFSKRASSWVIGFSIILLSHQVWSNVILLKAESTEKPAVYQLNTFLEKKDQPVILYTWEETRVLQYLHASYPHKRINTYQFFKSELKYYRGRTILLTDKVVQGFEAQGYSLDGKIEKIARFQSNELFDPVYHEITVYKWIEE